MITINEKKLSEIKAEEIRQKRNALLVASDWTMLDDSPADKQAWKKVRQELRDIPQQDSFPHHVDWPNLPEM
ncbi:tail fiber assembly protein [Cedecea davisae]|uniref:tail fiber assembly protein n=1 Tax=Cedecea davisae TaxID=158484 RepID=UPI002432FC24|nr:tail fiber assembly protein [Cedecea davisae]